MRRKQNRNGFTLAELLIVVAIIAVLVGISIPIFNSQLKKARLATNQANARAAAAAAEAAYVNYSSEHGSVPINNAPQIRDYKYVSYTYFLAAGNGIIDFRLSDRYNLTWIYRDKISNENDISKWTVDTDFCEEKNDDGVAHHPKLGDYVMDVWTVFMDPERGLSHLAIASDARILDAGCGGGANVKRLSGRVPNGHVFRRSLMVCPFMRRMH